MLCLADRARTCAPCPSAGTRFVFLLLALFATVASTQVLQASASDTDLQPYVGTWCAKFQGKTFLTIVLKKQDGKLVGTRSRSELQVDDKGELTSAEPVDGSDPILEANLSNGILRITTKLEDSHDVVQFDMKLTGANQAELRLHAPPDVPTPKPWKLERTKAVP